MDKFFCLFQDGEIHPVSVKVGEKVLLPEYGGTKIVLEDKVGFPMSWKHIKLVPKCHIVSNKYFSSYLMGLAAFGRCRWY